MADAECGGNQNFDVKNMKTNYWMLLGTMLATGAVAQVNTNTLPEIPAPATIATPVAPQPIVAQTTSAVAPAKAKPAPKKRVVKKINEPSVTLVPGTATVIPPNLNMRGQAGVKGEVIGHLKKGDTVTVLSQINLDKHALDEPAQWAKILLPTGTTVWIHDHFIDTTTKTVTASRLNLRGGPGENFSVLGVLEKGQTVNQLSTKGNWIEIQAPDTAFAYVAAMYLEQASPAAIVSTTPPPVTSPASTTPSAVIHTAPPAQIPPSSETMPVETAVNNGAISTTPAMTSPVEPVIETTPPTNLPPRVVSHEGRVRGSVSPVAPTPYELFDPTTGNAVNYLYTSSTNLNLSRYTGAQIIVTGEEGLAPRWKDTPVLTIQRIFVVDANPPVAYETVQSPRATQKNIRGSKPQQRR
jgi:uncharacterized protein YgiM (DUF1202 family)